MTTSLEAFPKKKKLWVWGYNSAGQHGNGSWDKGEHSVASFVTYFAEKELELHKIACGPMHSAVISSENLFMWGNHGGYLCGCVSMAYRVAIPTKVNFVNLRKGLNVRCVDVQCSKNHNLAICEEVDPYRGNTRKVLYSWGICDSGRLGHDTERRNVCIPRKILFFSDDGEDCTVIKIGVGPKSSYCVFEKKFFHLNDQGLQEEKIEFLKVLWGN